MTAIDHVVRYQEHVSEKPYEELGAAFEDSVANGESSRFAQAFQSAANSEHSRETWEAALRPLLLDTKVVTLITELAGAEA